MSSILNRNEEIRIKKARRRRTVTLAFTVTLCTIAAIAIFIYIVNRVINKEYNDYTVLISTPRQDSNSVQYAGYNKMLLKYSRDGASGIDSKGESIWNGSYEMNNPQISTCENYVAIADIGGKEVYVYNGANSGILIEEILPIVQVEVARQGVVAVVLEDTSSNEIHIYDSNNNGELLVTIPTNVSEDGYPVDISLSPDGKKLVTSFMGINSGIIENKITFYNFGSVGKDKNHIVGGFSTGQEICPRVEFISNDDICIFGETGFWLYFMPEISDEVYTEAFEQPIKSIMYNDKYVGFVLEEYDQNEKYLLMIYDMNGEIVLKKKVEYEYNKVYFTQNEIIFLSDLSCVMMRFNGDIKWDYQFDKGVNWIFQGQERDHYIFIDNLNINQVKLSEVKK